MKVTGIFSLGRLLIFAGVMAFCIHPTGVLAAVSANTLIETKLGGSTILNSPADKLIAAVQDCVKANPQRAAGIVAAVLKAGRADTDAIAPKITTAAILGLGSNPSSADVGAIITASVKAAPAVVLETVRAAAKAAPNCVTAIVRSAIAAVPDPNARVQPLPTETADSNSTDNSNTAMSPPSDGYTKDGSKDLSKEGGDEVPPIPIGEAIAQAAGYNGPPIPPDPPTQPPIYYYPPNVPFVSR